MKFDALATDYDGTIAHDGIVDRTTIDALSRARDAGLRLILVTGRELTNLLKTFPQSSLFDRIVAENGAVLYDPATQTVDVIASAPPRPLLDRLSRDNVPIWIGHSIVATVERTTSGTDGDSRTRSRMARHLQQGIGHGAAR